MRSVASNAVVHGLPLIDATEIAPQIYQGGVPEPGCKLRKAGFDLLVLCAAERQKPSKAYCGMPVLHVPMLDDELTDHEWAMAADAAVKIAAAVRRGKRVLITCRAGINRSSLVTALTLRQLTGRSGAELVAHIRSRRANALSNGSFVRALSRLR